MKHVEDIKCIIFFRPFSLIMRLGNPRCRRKVESGKLVLTFASIGFAHIVLFRRLLLNVGQFCRTVTRVGTQHTNCQYTDPTGFFHLLRCWQVWLWCRVLWLGVLKWFTTWAVKPLFSCGVIYIYIIAGWWHFEIYSTDDRYEYQAMGSNYMQFRFFLNQIYNIAL